MILETAFFIHHSIEYNQFLKEVMLREDLEHAMLMIQFQIKRLQNS